MKQFSSLAILVMCALCSAVASCGSGDDYTVITVSPSTCVVTNVELGKIPCVVNLTTAEGEDSTYVASITGSNYPMSIDHYGGRIFNVDSLPYGCDAAKVTFATLASSGTLAINSLSQDVDTFFVATDSTDFRTPRRVTVYAPDGIAVRSYMLEVRVHQQEGDAFEWLPVGECSEVATDGIRLTALMAHEGILYAYGLENGVPIVLTAMVSAPTEWHKETMGRTIEAPTAYEDRFYALSNGVLVESADGVIWTEVATNLSSPLLTLVAGSTALYGVTGMGFVSSVNGTAWTPQAADELEYLPTENCSGACLSSPTDGGYEDIVVVGSRSGAPVVWKLNVDKSGMYSYEWNYYPESSLNKYPCPELPLRKVFAYDSGTLLLGAEKDGASVVRLSRDNGRTWTQKEIPQLESIIGAFVATVDSQHFVWIIGADGKILKGRFNRLGWVQQDRVFV